VFSLKRTQFPGSKADLAEAVDQALRTYVRKDQPVVTINARVFPYLDEIAINLDGAEFDGARPEIPQIVGETKKACEAAVVGISARNVSMHGAPVNLQVEARDVVFYEGRNEANDVILIIHGIRTGHLVASAAQADLEAAVRRLAESEGRKNGIVVEDTRVAMRARGVRSIAVDVHLRARKLLLRANVDVSAQIDIEENFAAKISNFKCRGDGMLGSMACGALEPQLKQLEGRTISLIPPSLDSIRLRDVRITVADTVEVTADFGIGAG
jgi:hypothetical protein